MYNNATCCASLSAFRAGEALVADAMLDVTKRGGIVLDIFGGSGTTLIAAEKAGRVARLVEFDPLYCDVIVRRFEAYTGKQAVMAETADTFEAVTEAKGATVPE